MPEPQESSLSGRENSLARKMLHAAGALGILGLFGVGGFLLNDAEAPDWKGVDITATGRNVIDGIENVGPAIIGLGALELGLLATRGQRMTLRMAFDGMEVPKHGRVRNFMAGALLPSVGIAALTMGMSIEGGVREGPSRHINLMTSDVEMEASKGGKQLVWMLQPGTLHLMDESDVSPEVINKFQTSHTESVVPFRANLTVVPTSHNNEQAGLVIHIPQINNGPSPLTPDVREGALCKREGDKCMLEPNELIVDSNEGFKMGQSVTIRNQEFKVVGFSEEDQSLLNRLVVYAGSSPNRASENYYGFVTLAESKEAMQDAINKLGFQNELSPETTEELIKYTEGFWANNGTPLLLLLIGDLLVFAGAAFYGARKYEQEKTRGLMGGLRGIGLTRRQITEQRIARATILTAKGIVPGALSAVAAQQFINSVLTGFHAEVRPEMWLGASGALLAVQLSTSVKSMIEESHKTPAQMMRNH